MPIMKSLKSAWNAFRNEDPYVSEYGGHVTYGGSSPSRPRHVFSVNDRSLIASIYTRISIDVASITIRHIKVDDEGRYVADMETSLNSCLTFEPNLDQAPRAFRQALVLTLFDRGVAAVVPVETLRNPNTNEIFEIYSMRVGEIVKWYPSKVRVRVYNELKAIWEEVTLDKRCVAIIENPLYGVMNEPNSTLQRLIRKLNQLDAVDDLAASGKLDIIIQLPYTIKSQARRDQAEKRREEIEFQLKDSKYGIAYADATEKITQLNRPAENNMLGTVEFLVEMLYGQLGITEEVMNGTADEKVMINYFNRSIEPIASAIVEAMQRAFVGDPVVKKEKIHFFKDLFKLVPISQLAEIVDKFTRNEVFSSNEVRGFMGVQPSKDPKADQLVNSNLKADDTRATPDEKTTPSDDLPAPD